MDKRISFQKITLKLRNPFRISYGTSEERQAYWIRLQNDSGWGEGTIPPYYGVSSMEMETFWRQANNNGLTFPDDPGEIINWVGSAGPAPARCALDLALHDRIARNQNKPLYELLELPYPEPQPSAFTIALDAPAEMAKMANEVFRYPIIKVKLGGDPQDLERLAAIREVRPDVRLWVDANGGWSFDEAKKYLRNLESLNVEMVEQPLEKFDIAGLGKLQSETDIPIVADESVQSSQNIIDLAAAGAKGINIKLMKVGGIAPALKMIELSKQLGLQVMLGCMIETAIGTTAMAHLGSLAQWLDLDASKLISNDPFEGLIFDDEAVIRIRDRVGIGVTLKDSEAQE